MSKRNLPVIEEIDGRTEIEKKKARVRKAKAKLRAKKKLLERMKKKKEDEGNDTYDLKGKPRFEVKKWNACCIWKYDIHDDICAICRNDIMEVCIECQANRYTNTDENCVIAFGACSHSYHFHCIARFLKVRNVCPLCNKNWELERVSN